MTIHPLSFGILLAAATIAASTQQPVIQNGRVDVRPGTAIDREVAAMDRTQPGWIGWRVPIAAGRRGGCCVYQDDANAPYGVRGCFVERSPTDSGVPQVDAARAAVPLEAGSGLVLLVRVVDGIVERLRTVGDDCPLDAGGRTVSWLPAVTPAESLRFLEDLIRRGADPSAPRIDEQLKDTAITAMAAHADPGADAILDRLASSDVDTATRRRARSLLGTMRGAHGFDTLRRLLDAERVPDTRRQLVSALGQTREPGTGGLMLTLARTDADPRVRAEAVYWLPQRGGAQSARDTLAIINADAADAVRQRGVQGLARAATGDAVAMLLELARTSQHMIVKKEAVAALGRSKDPRAAEYVAELLR